jgi:thiol-disulfide isomerase/thioredoxin
MRRVVLVIVATLALGACGGSTDGGRTGTVLDASFTKFDGTTASVRDFRGKPVVINFFSSTCIPCQAEMPDFERVHRDLGDAVTFLGLDVQDTVDDGKAFAATVGVTWVLGREPTAQILQGQLRSQGLPTTVVLDKDGRIVFINTGQVHDLAKQLRDHHVVA